MSDIEDYYQILGIERSASSKDVKDAYLHKVHILHPDRMSTMPEGICIQAEEGLFNLGMIGSWLGIRG